MNQMRNRYHPGPLFWRFLYHVDVLFSLPGAKNSITGKRGSLSLDYTEAKSKHVSIELNQENLEVLEG